VVRRGVAGIRHGFAVAHDRAHNLIRLLNSSTIRPPFAGCVATCKPLCEVR
jgi:hypothetical protein